MVVSPTALRLSYDNEVQLSFTCHDFVPDLESATISRLGVVEIEMGPTEALFSIVQSLMADMQKDKSTQPLALVRELLFNPCLFVDVSTDCPSSLDESVISGQQLKVSVPS